MTGRGGLARALRETALAALFFLGYTVLATWPQAADLSGTLVDLLDAKLSAWIFHWDYVQTLRDPLNLFQAPILYPAKYVLAFSENMYGAAVFGFPLLAAGASPVTNYNVLLLGGMFLSALSAWALARYVTGDALASLAAGVVYAFLPYKISQLPHVHMEWGAFLCLVFLFLLRYLDLGRRRDAVLLALVFAWNAIACIQYAFFTGFLVATVLVWELILDDPARKRRIPGALLAMGMGTLAFLPFAIPYKKASDLYGMRRSVGEMTFFSAQPFYFLSAGERNHLWGPLTERFRGFEGDFFPGVLALALAGLAVLRLRRASPPRPARADGLPAWRLRAARAMDAVVVLLIAAWVVARRTPHLQVGPMSLGDAGRVQVFLTVAVIVRLVLALPGRARGRGLGDYLRGLSIDRRAVLLLAVAAVGVLVCLGGHTPYYRFLFTTFGVVFRAIRVAARGVVLFQVALAVLAAWGLSILTRGRRFAARGAIAAAALAGITIEYRGFPLAVDRYDGGPLPVYEWLRGVESPAAVVELPLGFPYDCEYTLRQAEHRQFLVNGHSSFSPGPYEELAALVKRRPIPDRIWSAMGLLGGSFVIYHSHETQEMGVIAYADEISRAIDSGGLEVVRNFPHGGGQDFVLVAAGSPWKERLTRGAPSSEGEVRALFDETLRGIRRRIARLAPPFGGIHLPAEDQVVSPGFWAFGWALDDSGIAKIEVSTELGPAGVAQLGGRWPGLEDAYPSYPNSQRGGFGFPIPALPPGPHELVLVVVANDGGQKIFRRRIVIPVP